MGSDREGKMHVDMVGVDPGDVLRVSAEVRVSVPVRAVLRDSRTGKTGEERYEVEPKYAANQLFQWTEGNYSCDCNRSRFLNGADGVLECNTGENVIELVELWVGGERLI